jgi:hypothetical protein
VHYTVLGSLTDFCAQVWIVAPSLSVGLVFRVVHALTVSVVRACYLVDIIMREISVELYRCQTSFAFVRVLRGAVG